MGRHPATAHAASPGVRPGAHLLEGAAGQNGLRFAANWLAASPTLTVAALFALLGGGAEMAHTASNMAMMQMNAPEEMRGRISSLTMLYPVMISLGAFVAGPISDLLGVRGASVALASTAIGAIVALYFISPRLREMRFK